MQQPDCTQCHRTHCDGCPTSMAEVAALWEVETESVTDAEFAAYARQRETAWQWQDYRKAVLG